MTPEPPAISTLFPILRWPDIPACPPILTLSPIIELPAGSSIIGDNVKIGGQAGISGHLKIGNNVEIAGGSGVIKNIPDNTKVMGYPAKNIRDFLRNNRWYIKQQ